MVDSLHYGHVALIPFRTLRPAGSRVETTGPRRCVAVEVLRFMPPVNQMLWG